MRILKLIAQIICIIMMIPFGAALAVLYLGIATLVSFLGLTVIIPEFVGVCAFEGWDAAVKSSNRKFHEEVLLVQMAEGIWPHVVALWRALARGFGFSNPPSGGICKSDKSVSRDYPDMYL